MHMSPSRTEVKIMKKSALLEFASNTGLQISGYVSATGEVVRPSWKDAVTPAPIIKDPFVEEACSICVQSRTI